ncbi:MAG: hypothetical protein ACK55Z_23800, partial [bacterium]
RRLSKDNIEPFIRNAELDFPTLCDDFGDEFDYADNVIRIAIDDFLTEDEDFVDSLGDDYDDVYSYVMKIDLGIGHKKTSVEGGGSTYYDQIQHRTLSYLIQN